MLASSVACRMNHETQENCLRMVLFNGMYAVEIGGSHQNY
jgi:hypothetical protein